MLRIKCNFFTILYQHTKLQSIRLKNRNYPVVQTKISQHFSNSPLLRNSCFGCSIYILVHQFLTKRVVLVLSWKRKACSPIEQKEISNMSIEKKWSNKVKKNWKKLKQLIFSMEKLEISLCSIGEQVILFQMSLITTLYAKKWWNR